jgi:hypothetical protein
MFIQNCAEGLARRAHASGVAIAEKGTHFPLIKTELAYRFFRLLVEVQKTYFHSLIF